MSHSAAQILTVLLLGGCASGVQFVAGDARALTSSERSDVAQIAETTLREVREVLPQLPCDVLIRVRATHEVIPETGEAGGTELPRTVLMRVDPERLATARSWLRAGFAHELHHLVRDAHLPRIGTTVLNYAVTEGMATVFERDFADVDPPWAHYPPEVRDWLAEIEQLPPLTAWPKEWVKKHPDGRRWIAHKVGVYVVERAMEQSGLTAAQLVMMPAAQVVALAKASTSP